jgi:hypothetical protein
LSRSSRHSSSPRTGKCITNPVSRRPRRVATDADLSAIVDTACVPKSLISEDLGEVSYIMSDKVSNAVQGISVHGRALRLPPNRRRVPSLPTK